MVILGHWSFSFEDLDGDGVLVILIGREDLALLGWDVSTSWDNLGHDSSDGFNTKGQWSSVDKNHILGVFRFFTAKDTTLDSGTISDGFIRVNSSGWFFSVEEVLNELLDLWNSGRTSDKDDFVNLVLLETSVIQSDLDWAEGLLEQVIVEFFESGSGEGFREVLTIDETFNFDFSFVSVGKSSLGFFDFSLQFLNSSSVIREILVVFLLDELKEVIKGSLIEIFSSQMGIT
mmetsp:Transcript_45932/g.53122  ORF Transcript_45932/g.53122 Transcript_45932/m.53122 type:complete len:232 (-) Transcript_45932:768-1463(-)